MQPPPTRALTPLLVTIAVGLIAGVAELLVQAFYKFGLVRMVWTGWHALWMTPLSYAVLMVPLGGALAIEARLWPQVADLRLVLFVPVAAAAFSVLWLFYPAVHPLAIVILALGVAAAVTRVLADRPAGVERGARRIAAVGGTMVLLVAITVHGGRWIRERRATSALPAVDSSAPNVLVIVLDAVRARNLGLYGHSAATTPMLERFARRGATFTNAWSTSPWTLPSHASMFTGYYPAEIRADARHPLEEGIPTLSEELRKRGYETGGFVANVSYAGRESGLARGFAHFEDYLVTPAELVMSSAMGRFVALNPRLRDVLGYHDVLGRRKAGDITSAFLRWQSGVNSRPFLAFLNLYDAHEPYLPPDSFAKRFPGPVSRRIDQIRFMNVRMGERREKTSMAPPEQRAEEAAYDGAIAAIDAELGLLFAELEHRRILDRTITVIVGDHGEMFGEHGLFSHGHSLYRQLLNVPLVIVYPPAVPGGTRIQWDVTLRDLPATILALAGVHDHQLPGTALLPFDSSRAYSPILAEVRPAPGLREHYPASRGVMHSTVASGYQYIRDGVGAEELFALTDSAQAFNLAREPELQALLALLRAAAGAAPANGSVVGPEVKAMQEVRQRQVGIRVGVR